MNKNQQFKKLTDDELLEKMNKSLKGRFYPDKVAMKLVKIAKERGCKISELPEELKQKAFSDVEG